MRNDLYKAFKGKHVLVGSLREPKYQGVCVAAGREGIMLKNNGKYSFVFWSVMKKFNVELTDTTND